MKDCSTCLYNNLSCINPGTVCKRWYPDLFYDEEEEE
jgi:hypothetical protein